MIFGMAETQKLTKKEKKVLRKQEWQDKLAQEQKNQRLKKIGIWIGAIAIIIASVGGLILFATSSSNSTTPTQTSINVKPISSTDVTRGNKNAKVTLIEYSDFQCPACAAFHPLVNQLLSDYGNKIYFVYRFFPLTNIHQNAMISAQAGYAAYKQGKFWEMGDLLFNNQNDWADLSDPTSVFVGYAQKLNLDVNKFKEDMNSDQTKNFIQSEQDEGNNAGITYTPSFILNGKLISNPTSYDAFKQLIDNELNKK